jgi:hypothetical protein
MRVSATRNIDLLVTNTISKRKGTLRAVAMFVGVFDYFTALYKRLNLHEVE